MKSCLGSLVSVLAGREDLDYYTLVSFKSLGLVACLVAGSLAGFMFRGRLNLIKLETPNSQFYKLVSVVNSIFII